jgi:hypothetical protein
MEKIIFHPFPVAELKTAVPVRPAQRRFPPLRHKFLSGRNSAVFHDAGDPAAQGIFVIYRFQE